MNEWLERHWDEVLEKYTELLSYQSISSDIHFASDMHKCALYLQSELLSMGFSVDVLEADGRAPVIVARSQYDDSKKNIVLYHHYDVQPPGPLSEWDSPPFEATIKDGAVYARGAQDNKGQLSYTLASLFYFYDTNQQLPCNVTLIIEGEEECGSAHLNQLLSSQCLDLSCDELYIIDNAIPLKDSPSLTLGLRGVISYDLFLTTAKRDVHSGLHGGLAENAITVLSTLISKLCSDSSGSCIEGFQKEIESINPDLLKQLDTSFNDEEYKKSNDVFVMKNQSQPLRILDNWIEPSIECNGIISGHTGSGAKTIIPHAASCKLSIRTVAHQTLETVTDSLFSFIANNIPSGVKFSLNLDHHGEGVFPTHVTQASKRSRDILESVYKRHVSYILSGASIPITAKLSKACGVLPVLLGTGLYSDNIHSPNEHYTFDSFRKGFMIMTHVLSNRK